MPTEKSHKIVVVDDNPQSLRLLDLLLKKNNFEVVTAVNGEQGSRAISEHQPDLILLDVVLPDINGIELCRQVKSDPALSNSLVILLSGHQISTEHQVQGLEAGADGYLVRPISNKELLARVRALLRIREAENKAKHLNAVFQAIRNVNQFIVREKGRDQLLEGVCQALISNRSYYNAWIVLLDEDSKLVTTAEAGLGDKFLPMVDKWNHQEPIDCARLALDEPEPVVIDNPYETCTGCPLAHLYRGRGGMAIKLEHDGRLLGLLVVSVPVDFMGAEETSLTKEVASDIAFALHSLEQEQAIQQHHIELEAANQDLQSANQELRETQQKLLESEEKHRLLAAERLSLLIQIQEQARRIQQTVDAVPEGVLLLDQDNKIILANPAAKASLPLLAELAVDKSLAQLGGRPLTEFFELTDRTLWHEISLTGDSKQVFEVAAQPLGRDSGQEGWVLVLREVTQEREIQRRAQQQERLAAVGQLAAGIAHDFNNILAVIVLYSQMGLAESDLSPLMRERLATMDIQARRATHLIQQILDFSRQAILERRPMDLAPFLKEQVKLLQRTLPENVQIRLTQGASEFTLSADPTRLQQAIMNLAVNARDAMPDGGDLRFELERLRIEPEEVPPLPEMTLQQIQQGEALEWLRLTISDSGTGINTENLPHIFEPFFTTKSPGAGSGLGLAQVYGIVKQHEGYIDVQTEEGKGTSFVIYLPSLPQTNNQKRGHDRPPLAKGNQQAVLVVEDDALVRSALASSLEVLNYLPIEASNGREALEILQSDLERVELVITDLVMPELGGSAFLSDLKELKPSLKVLVLTGYPLEDSVEELRAAGMSDWMEKPVNLRTLAKVIAQTMYPPV